MSSLKHWSRRTLLAVLALQLVVITDADADQDPATPSLTRRGSCQAIRGRIADAVVQQAFSIARWQQHRQRRTTRSGVGRAFGNQPSRKSIPKPQSSVTQSAPMPSADIATRSAASAGFGGASLAVAMDKEEESGPSHFTGTNTQEAGVDEADIVETDGRYIYTVQKGELLILKSWPPSEASIVSRTKLASHITPAQILLRDDTLVLLGQVSQRLSSYQDRTAYWQRNYGRAPNETKSFLTATRVVLVGIADRAAPVLERKYDVEGSLVQARMVQDDLYLVTSAQLHVPHNVWKTAVAVAKKNPRWRRVVRANVMDAMGAREMAEVMPRTRQGWGRERMNGLKPLYDCSDVLLADPSGLAVLNLSHLNVARTRDVASVGLQASSHHVYASHEALYVAGQPRSFPQMGHGTPVHKFDLRGGGDIAPVYVASGAVEGQLLNQFAMSEHNHDLRVATTSNRGNNLFVLRQRGDSLSSVGAVTGLAKGERIYAVRMFGDQGYVVTFRRTDPLYTLDLSEPEQPRVVGELKIPGFSSYIHPLEGQRLLTIGQDADQNGRVRGLHLQIFDVSDPANPRRTVQKVVNPSGHSASAAQNNHLAFTYDPVSSTLAIPLQTSGRESFVGLALYRVNPTTVDDLGRVSHQLLANAAIQGPRRNGRSRQLHAAAPPISRSIIMDAFVFTLSNLGLMVNQLDNPSQAEAGVLFAKSMEPNNRLAIDRAPTVARAR